jgi:hypothetical protein
MFEWVRIKKAKRYSDEIRVVLDLRMFFAFAS